MSNTHDDTIQRKVPTALVNDRRKGKKEQCSATKQNFKRLQKANLKIFLHNFTACHFYFKKKNSEQECGNLGYSNGSFSTLRKRLLFTQFFSL